MRIIYLFPVLAALSLHAFRVGAQSTNTEAMPSHLYIDVHHMGAGKVTTAAVADAHAKDLAVQKKYGVQFLQYWVDEAAGNVYCLSSSADTQSIRKTHAEAHGLLPDQIYPVTEGQEAQLNGAQHFYLDVHEFPEKVSAKDVAAAHQKDLAVQGKRGVNFINYWVSDNVVMCLSQASDPSAVIETHKEAHGLIPVRVVEVSRGK